MAERQKELVLRGDRATPRFQWVAPGDLPDNRLLVSPDPVASFVDDVAAHGILEPIILEEVGESFRVFDGIRRIKAAREAGLDEVPAMIYPTGSLAAGVTLTTNYHRSHNRGAEFLAVMDLMETRQMSADAIAEALRISKSKIRKLMRLRDLTEDARTAYLGGDIRTSTAEALAKLPPDVQDELVKASVEADQKLTLKKVKEVRDALATEKVAAAPARIFDTPDAPEEKPVVYPVTLMDGQEYENMADVLAAIREVTYAGSDAEGNRVHITFDVRGVNVYRPEAEG